jgi:perosamine synthetase
MIAFTENSMSRLSVSAACFDGKEKEYLLDCLNRNWISQGYYVQKFEERFADLCGKRYAIACSSGTAALHLALLAYSIGSEFIGSKHGVIVPALTYIATANAARYCGAQVHFADIDAKSWCLDADSVDALYSQLLSEGICVAAILPVDLYDAIAFSTPHIHMASIIRDAAHSTGIQPNAMIATYSFYGSKIISCGEGGMLVTNDESLMERAKLYRGQGATIPGVYHHSVVGYNYRMTDLQAAVGLAQLERLKRHLTIRRLLANRYRDNLSGIQYLTLQGGERASAWTFALLLPEGVERKSIANRLLEDGIETRPFFDSIPSLPPYLGEVPPVAASIAPRGLLLPLHCAMDVGDVDYICERLIESIKAEAAGEYA